MIILKILFDILILLLLDIILSVDNAVLISMSTKELKGKDKRIASLFGALGAVLLRLIFVILLIFFLEVMSSIPVIYILGGGLLLYIGWNITKENKEDKSKVKSSQKILKAIATIIAADIIMSFDNALIISEVVVGIEWGFEQAWIGITLNGIIVSIALLLSLVLILFSSSAISKFMEKYSWVVYLGCWLLLSIGIEMILKDQIFKLFFEDGYEFPNWLHYVTMIGSYGFGAILTVINWFWRKSWSEKLKN